MNISCVRRIQFCAGHRVLGHENKCAHPHGHNYVVYIHATAPVLDRVGRVIDFSVLKDKIGGWIEENWDHKFLIYVHDEKLMAQAKEGDWKHFAMLKNPTAENMATFLLMGVCPNLLDGTNVLVDKVVVHETENCFAEAVL